MTANCALTKEAFDEAGGFDEAFTMAWREDSDLHFKLLRTKIPIVKCMAAEVIHPVRSAPWNVSIRSEKKTMFNVLLYKKHPDLYAHKIGLIPLWNYYAIILMAIISLTGIILNNKVLFISAIFLWFLFVAEFTMRRLKNSRKTFNHIVQMTITSAIIPVVSVYWRMYGSLKFRKLLI